MASFDYFPHFHNDTNTNSILSCLTVDWLIVLELPWILSGMSAVLITQKPPES